MLVFILSCVRIEKREGLDSKSETVARAGLLTGLKPKKCVLRQKGRVSCPGAKIKNKLCPMNIKNSEV